MRSIRRAFTLIELLVVVAIIALLIALLMPTLARAKMMSVRATCLSNLRGCGIGFMMYAGNNRGDVVVGLQPPGGHYWTWADLLSYGYDFGAPPIVPGMYPSNPLPPPTSFGQRVQPSYIHPKMIHCPTDPSYAAEMTNDIAPNIAVSNSMDVPSWGVYGMFMVDTYSGDPAAWSVFQKNIDFWPRADGSPSYNYFMEVQKLPMIPQPSQMMMLADSNNHLKGTQVQGSPQFRSKTGSFYFGSGGVCLAHGMGGKVPITGAIYNTYYVVMKDTYTGGTSNVAYYDGHAEVRSLKDMRYGINQVQYFWDQGRVGALLSPPDYTKGFWVK